MRFLASEQDLIQKYNRIYKQIHGEQTNVYPRLRATGCGSKTKNQNSFNLGCVFASSCSLAVAIIGIGASRATAQLVIQSTGTLSGTIQLPSFNPNYNGRITTVDTDSNGTYMRNIGTKQNPNFVHVYTSDYVRVRTRADGSLSYYVDFKGIPVISLDGVLSSPALSGGQLESYKYQGIIPGTKFQGVVQDEFGLTKAFYTGIVTDPKTGQQYQGTFEVNGQGPRYSDSNGGDSPTVFDFKSDLPGSPTVTSLKMTDSPLVRLTIKVPENAIPISSGGGSTTPTPPPPPPPPPISNPTPTPPPPPPPPPISNPTPTPPPTTPISNPTPPTTPFTSDANPTTSPTTSTDSTPAPTPIADNSSVASLPTPTTDATESNSPSPYTLSEVEFSNGTSLNITPNNSSSIASDLCSKDYAKQSAQCRTRTPVRKQLIGPRSRVLLR
ncbi:hypothetical protein NUACC21_46170 [Scytonema sp. NUACC21]